MRRLGVVYAAAVALSACGGSGGGDAILVTYRESTVSRVVFDDELTTYYSCVRATLSPVPADVALVRIVDLGGAFAAGNTSASDLGSGTFEACLNYAPTLTPGVHAGTLRLDLCKDAGCAAVHPLSDPDVPYSITVYRVVAGLPLLDAEILADGTPVSGVVCVQDGVANLDFHGDAFALFVGAAGADGNDLTLLRLFLRGLGQDDATSGDFFLLQRFDDQAIGERLKIHSPTASLGEWIG